MSMNRISDANDVDKHVNLAIGVYWSTDLHLVLFTRACGEHNKS